MTVRMHPQTRLNNARRDPGEYDESPTPDWNQVASDYLAKKQGDLPPHPLDGLPARPRKHRGLNSWEPVQFIERPEWHAFLTPKQVAAAWEMLDLAVRAASLSVAIKRRHGLLERAEGLDVRLRIGARHVASLYP